MRKLYSVTNFSEGINQFAAQGASNIENFVINTDGVLETRSGWTVNNSLTLSGSDGLVLQTFFANGKLYLQTTVGLYSVSSNTITAVSNQTGATGNPYTGKFAARLDVVVADNNRVFLASTNANLWMDTSTSTPALYNWGVAAPSISSFSFAAQNDSVNGELQPGWYAYAFAYELKHGGLSPLSDRKLVKVTDGNNEIQVTMPSAPNTWQASIDQQITGLAFYRTEKSTDVTFNEGEAMEKSLADSAPLKRAGSVPVSYSATTFDNGTVSYGIKPLAGPIEGASTPPSTLTNITLYGGRIWGSVGTSDQVVFSALDSTAAPLYDVFPDSSAPIPHVINVRDEVTGIGASRDYLAVFSENSIQMVKGQGIVKGIYDREQAGTDLDISDYLTLVGAKDRHCIAESLGNVFFYSSQDQRVYKMDRNGQVTWVSQPIQNLIDELETPSDSVVTQLVAHEGSVFLVRRSGQSVILLQYDSLRNQWTSHDFGSSASMTSFVSLPRKETEFDLGLYALRDNFLDQVVKIFPYSGAGSTNDNGTDIVPSYTSQEFAFTKPTRLDAVRIGTEQELTSNVTLNIYVDGSLSQVMTTGKLTKETDFTIRTFERGYKHKVAFFLSGAQTVRFFELQFRSR
jgi:hypothetical protein